MTPVDLVLIVTQSPLENANGDHLHLEVPLLADHLVVIHHEGHPASDPRDQFDVEF